VTSQTKILGFNLAGPKRMVGRDQFLQFLDALETELDALDPETGVVRRHSNAGVVEEQPDEEIPALELEQLPALSPLCQLRL
jgi:hypothetical protein